MPSLGLTLYRWGLPAPHGGAVQRMARPQGRLVWLRLSDPARAGAALLLAQHLRESSGLICLVTGLDSPPAEAQICTDAEPGAHPSEITEFLDHWAPQVIVMMGAALAPLLIDQARLRSIPLLMIEAEAPRLAQGKSWMLPGLLAQSARGFHGVMTVDEAAARAYRKLGAQNVMRTGRMDGGSLALPHNEAERSALAAVLATRPIWLAVDVPPEEEAAVIAAHRAALRLAHRLLLILMPSDAARAGPLAQMIEEVEGWGVARRDQDQDPDSEVAVYIADAGQEYGLWYRLAPVTFLGGSLHGAGSTRNPLEAAALGSAIIHGRKVGGYGQAFGQLGAALGAAPISTSAELAEFVSDLLSPDRVARMAQAAWNVASEGADVTDRLAKTIAHLASGGS